MAVDLVYNLNPSVVVASGLNPTGAYNGATAYNKGDSVSYNGSSYVAIQSTTGNLPTNTTYWQVLAQEGANGTNGQGVPTGGSAGQVLTKNSATNYDDSWQTPTSKGFIIAMATAL